MLQEVHCTENTNHVWSESNKAGVCILFNNNFNLQIQKLFIDPVGRFIICDIKANEKSLTLANIYAPNEDNPAFFLDFFEHLVNSQLPREEELLSSSQRKMPSHTILRIGDL